MLHVVRLEAGRLEAPRTAPRGFHSSAAQASMGSTRHPAPPFPRKLLCYNRIPLSPETWQCDKTNKRNSFLLKAGIHGAPAFSAFGSKVHKLRHRLSCNFRFEHQWPHHATVHRIPNVFIFQVQPYTGRRPVVLGLYTHLDRPFITRETFKKVDCSVRSGEIGVHKRCPIQEIFRGLPGFNRLPLVDFDQQYTKSQETRTWM